MLKFDEELYLKDGKTTYETRERIEHVADEISREGYENIFFISVGGSIAIMLPVVEMLKQLSDVPVYAEQAAEVILTGHRQLSKDSLVIMSSKSGDTKETVRAAEWCKENGYRVVSLVGTPDAPLEKLSRWVIPNRAKDGVEFEYMEMFMLIFKLLANRNEFPRYQEFADQLKKLPGNLVKAKQKFEPIADEIAKKLL